MTARRKTNPQGSAPRGALPWFLFLLLVLAGCGPRQDTFQGLALGTTYTVKVVGASGSSGAGRQAMQSAIAAELERVDAKMSTYREDSELSRFNRFGGSEPFEM